MKNENNHKAYLSATLYAIIIGFSFLFVKLGLSVTSPINLLAHRFTVAFITASVPVLFKRIQLKITFKDILPILPVSLFYPTLFFTFQTLGLVHISSSEAGIIQATIPLFTMILASILLKEHSSNIQKFSLILSVSGVVYIFIKKGISLSSGSFIGTILILLCALSTSFYSVLARKVTKKYKITDLTYMMTFIGFISFNLMALVTCAYNRNFNTFFEPFTSMKFIISILYLGTLSSYISSLLSNYTLSQIEASKMSVFNNLSTLITMISGVIFLDEKLYYYHIIGAFMIIVGILGTNLLDQKIKSKKAAKQVQEVSEH